MEKALQNVELSPSGTYTGPYRNAVVNHEALIKALFGMAEKSGAYLLAGKFDVGPRWLIYISVINVQFEDVVRSIATLYHRYYISIAVPATNVALGNLLDGTAGLANVGKVITIQFPSDKADELAFALIGLTEKFKGPEIPTAYRLGNQVFTQFERPIFNWPASNQIAYDHDGNWPFNSINRVKRNSAKRLGPYVIIQALKTDAKGSVYKALSLKNWLNIKWCVIKQGKAHQISDEFGRDIADRLQWQAEIHARLKEHRVLPEAYEFLEKNGDSYLVMEFIQGISYHQFISELQEGYLFRSLSKPSKLNLLSKATELVSLLSIFHQHGLLHRDLNPMNFMVEQSGRVIAIDVELAFDVEEELPYPWFTLGSNGYMSPQQRRLEYPSFADDIYGLGGLLIFTFTGISPAKFDCQITEEALFAHLSYFIDDHRTASIIAKCRRSNPGERPDLNAISHTLDLFKAKLLTHTNRFENESTLFTEGRHVIQRSLASFKGLTISRIKIDPLLPDLPEASFIEGAAGILYTFVKAEHVGHDLAQAGSSYADILNAFLLEIDKKGSLDNINGGLFSGTAGLSILLAELICQGHITKSPMNGNLIMTLMSKPVVGSSLADGLAGQGLAMLKVAELLDSPHIASSANAIAKTLLDSQNKDGSWKTNHLPTKNSGFPATGFFHGTAGIVYFLLVISERNKLNDFRLGAINGLRWLIRQINHNSGPILPVKLSSQAADPWIEHGFTGVAFVLLKAYEFTSDVTFMTAAVTLLTKHPKHISSNYNSFSNGLVGLGEVYLEAYRILNDHEWLDRAISIGDFLIHTCCVTSNNQVYWLEGNESKPSSNFANGNAGILHFFIRLIHANDVPFPLIDFRP